MLLSLNHCSTASEQQRSLLTDSGHGQILINAKEQGGGGRSEEEEELSQTLELVVILQQHASFQILLPTLEFSCESWKVCSVGNFQKKKIEKKIDVLRKSALVVQLTINPSVNNGQSLKNLGQRSYLLMMMLPSHSKSDYETATYLEVTRGPDLQLEQHQCIKLPSFL